jgi:hypothetical protein
VALAFSCYAVTAAYVYLQFSTKIREQAEEEQLLSSSFISPNALVMCELIVLALSLAWFITIPWGMARRRRRG